MAGSEVARLLERITLEQEAAKRALYGISEGSARHDFITRHMERIGLCHEQLAKLVGPEQAMQKIAEVLEKL